MFEGGMYLVPLPEGQRPLLYAVLSSPNYGKLLL
jgi:hypothetical protein